MTLAVPSNVADHLLEKIVGGDIKIAGGSRRSHSTSPTETTGVPGLVGPASGGVPSPRNSGEMKEEVSERDARAGMDDKSILESPQEHEIAAALFDLANVASAGQLEGRGESDAPSRPGSGSPAASAKRGAAGEGAAAETQTRKRPRKPNRNLDAYHGYQDNDPDDMEPEVGPPLRHSTANWARGSQPRPETSTADSVSAGAPGLDASGGGAAVAPRGPPTGPRTARHAHAHAPGAGLTGPRCMLHARIALWIQGVQRASRGTRGPADQLRASAQPAHKAQYHATGHAGLAAQQLLQQQAAQRAAAAGPQRRHPHEAGGGDTRALLEAQLASRLGARQLDGLLANLPPGSMNLLANLLSAQGGAGGQQLGAPTQHRAAPAGHLGPRAQFNGYHAQYGGGAPPAPAPQQRPSLSNLPELLAQVMAQQQGGGANGGGLGPGGPGLLHGGGGQAGYGVRGAVGPAATARLQQLYAGHAAQQAQQGLHGLHGAGGLGQAAHLGYGGGAYGARAQGPAAGGPPPGPPDALVQSEVAQALRALQGLVPGGGGQTPPPGHGGAEGDAGAGLSQPGQLAQIAKLVQALTGGAGRGGGGPPPGRGDAPGNYGTAAAAALAAAHGNGTRGGYGAPEGMGADAYAARRDAQARLAAHAHRQDSASHLAALSQQYARGGGGNAPPAHSPGLAAAMAKAQAAGQQGRGPGPAGYGQQGRAGMTQQQAAAVHHQQAQQAAALAQALRRMTPQLPPAEGAGGRPGDVHAAAAPGVEVAAVGRPADPGPAPEDGAARSAPAPEERPAAARGAEPTRAPEARAGPPAATCSEDTASDDTMPLAGARGAAPAGAGAVGGAATTSAGAGATASGGLAPAGAGEEQAARASEALAAAGVVAAIQARVPGSAEAGMPSAAEAAGPEADAAAPGAGLADSAPTPIAEAASGESPPPPPPPPAGARDTAAPPAQDEGEEGELRAAPAPPAPAAAAVGAAAEPAAPGMEGVPAEALAGIQRLLADMGTSFQGRTDNPTVQSLLRQVLAQLQGPQPPPTE
ncbi:hypothetical protein ACKKBF_B34825 [Auxenochlorella protothecoides x Auxenochlorella symbiontica]